MASMFTMLYLTPKVTPREGTRPTTPSRPGPLTRRFRLMTLRIKSVLLAATLAGAATLAHAENWPGWRGPRGDGTSLEQGIPTQWTANNLLWKTEIPGLGHASPIVWRNRIFVVSA